jgi:hypothetical protein
MIRPDGVQIFEAETSPGFAVWLDIGINREPPHQVRPWNEHNCPRLIRRVKGFLDKWPLAEVMRRSNSHFGFEMRCSARRSDCS